MTALPPLGEYLADEISIYANCAADIPCGHAAELDLGAIIAAHSDIRLDELRRRLRCTDCGHRPGEIRLVNSGRPGTRDSRTLP